MAKFSAHLFLDTLILNSHNIKNPHLKNLPLGSEVKILLLRDNLIDSFLGMPSSNTLENLDLSGNPLLSARGFPHFPHLLSISIWDTPLSKCSNHRLVLLLVCPSLTQINEISISSEEKRTAKSFPKECRNFVRAGWIGAPSIPSEQDLGRIQRQLTDQWSPIRKERVSKVYDLESERRDFVFVRTHPIVESKEEEKEAKEVVLSTIGSQTVSVVPVSSMGSPTLEESRILSRQGSQSLSGFQGSPLSGRKYERSERSVSEVRVLTPKRG
jgi:hypothetical protein